ncbi:MAG: DUF1844 domain-containing protein, partial [Terracidiphilus sp.]
MSDNPKFEVIDRRKFKAEVEHDTHEPEREPEKPKAPPEPAPGPKLVENEPRKDRGTESAAVNAPAGDELEELAPPSAEESDKQKAAYNASAQRIEDLIRAQNPALGAQPPVTFEHLVQQVYLTAMLQMGAGVQEGEPARVDIVGARAS